MGIFLKKSLQLWGGFLGFVLCLATGWVAGVDIGQSVFNASLGCLAGGLLAGWWADVMNECVRVQRSRVRQAAQTAQQVAKEIKK